MALFDWRWLLDSNIYKHDRMWISSKGGNGGYWRLALDMVRPAIPESLLYNSRQWELKNWFCSIERGIASASRKTGFKRHSILIKARSKKRLIPKDLSWCCCGGGRGISRFNWTYISSCQNWTLIWKCQRAQRTWGHDRLLVR